MPYGPLPVRFARPVGWRSYATIFWGSCPVDNDGMHEHVSRLDVASGDGPLPDGASSDAFEAGHAIDVLFGPCERCGAPWDGTDGSRSASGRTIFDTPSGKLEPGCLWWHHCLTSHCPMLGPPACDGRHLHAVLPDGHQWDVDGRASNCTRPTEPHRCWVRHFDPETETAIFHVDKEGDTCAAGAGSIADGEYHGFLHNGSFSVG